MADHQLAELFPSLPRGLLLDVLQQRPNLEDAVTSLLQLTDSGTPVQTAKARQAPASASKARRPQAAASKPRRSASWGELALAANLQDRLQLHSAPIFTGASPVSPAFSLLDFPPALPAQPTSSTPLPGGAAFAAASRGPGVGGQPPNSRQHAPTSAAVPPVQAWQATVAPSSFGNCPQPPASSQASYLVQGLPRTSAPSSPAQQLQREQAKAAQLGRCHPWAGTDLVNTVLSAVNYDLDTAGAILADMAAPTAGSQAAELGLGDPGNASGGCWDGGEWYSSGDELDAPQDHPRRSCGRAYAAAVYDDFVVAAAAVGPRARAAGLVGAAAAVAAGGGLGARQQPQAAARPPHSATPWDGEGDVAAQPQASSSTDDVYWRHRAEALRLSREYQKALKKAAKAYSGGSRSKAQLLAAEAQRLRQEMTSAHEGAATRIEAELNSAGSLFELDLHGLYATEAVAALNRRLTLLQTILQDATIQPQGGSGHGSHGQQRARGDGYRGVPPAPPQPMQPLRAAQAGVLPANGQWLRVVVGRGAHSSGGEASIPRAVEGRLLELGYKFQRQTGALDVQLRRPFAGQKGAAGLPKQ